MAVAFEGRPGLRFVSSSCALSRDSCTRLSVSSAFVAALAAARCLSGHRRRDGFAQFMLDMEEVRRVMRPQVMFNIREESRGFITGRLDHLTMQAGQGLLHQACQVS